MSAEQLLYGDLALELETQQWVVSNLIPHVSLRFKQLFPKVDKASTGPFHVSAGLDGSADIEWFTSRYPLRVTDKNKRVLRKRSRQFRAHHAELGRISTPEWVPTERAGLKPGQVFFSYQKAALDFIERTRQCLIIDDIGIGKTYEGLGIATLPGTLPMAVVCSTHLQKQWHKKSGEFIDLEVHSIKGTRPYSLPPADIYLFKYSQLAGWVDVLCKPNWLKSIAFDEVHHLRTGDESAKGRAARKVCETVIHTGGVVAGLSATLTWNYGVESFVICDILKPGCLGTRSDFIREWCGGDAKGRVIDPHALGSYLQEVGLVLRRTKEDVGQTSQAQRSEMFWVEPDSDGLEESERLAEQLAQTALTGGFSESGQAARHLDMRLRQMTGIAKVRAGASIAKVFLENKTPIIIFAWHREVYRILEEELAEYKPAFYTGAETPSQKNKSAERFLDGDTDALVMSLGSGEGLDGLQERCRNVIFLELSWSPSQILQCIGRVDRDDPQFPVYPHFVVSNYGSDPAMLDILGLKDEQGHGIINPGKERETKQLDSERFKKLATKFLESRGIEPNMRLPITPELKPGDQLNFL